jgi:DNA-binding transcriptional MerR regulator
MFSIGEFARHGRVSVRMLRHYDAIGLLRPACVDPASGYRFYQAGQSRALMMAWARSGRSGRRCRRVRAATGGAAGWSST